MRKLIPILCFVLILAVLPALTADEPKAGERLYFDLWYTIRSSDISTTHRKTRLAGKPGEEVSFRFLPVRHAFSGTSARPGQFGEIILDISGTIAGKKKPDGSIELEIQLTRSIETVRQGRPGRDTVRDGGTTTLKVRPDEAIRVELPSPMASSGFTPGVMGGEYQMFVGSTEAFVIQVRLDSSTLRKQANKPPS